MAVNLTLLNKLLIMMNPSDFRGESRHRWVNFYNCEQNLQQIFVFTFPAIEKNPAKKDVNF